MRKLFNNLKYLKLGTNPIDYPIYSQLLFAVNNNLYTCNGSDSVIVFDADLGFEGAVNFYVLENILRLSDGEIEEHEVDSIHNILFIKNGRLKTLTKNTLSNYWNII